jgi:hypothetical protein
MTILLQQLVEHAWVFYVACAIGVLIYVMRALAAHRERSLALFTLERETATSRVVRAWAMVFVFVVIGIVIFVGANYVLPSLSADSLGQPSPTATLSSGVQPPTPGSTVMLNSTPDVLVPTVTSTAAPTPVPTVLAPLPTEPPTPEPTETPPGDVSGGVGVQFGDFLELANFGLPASEFTTAEPLPLTIYWRKLDGNSPVDYLVFTHLLAEDGHLIGQHDGPPAGGARPITQWAAGEIVEDFHPMAFQDTGYVGPARIAVGLYDPATGRALTSTGSDHVILPVAITIVAR